MDSSKTPHFPMSRYFKWTKRYRKLPFKFWPADEHCELCKLAHRQNYTKIGDYQTFVNTTACTKNYAHWLAKNNTLKIWREERRLKRYMHSKKTKNFCPLKEPKSAFWNLFNWF